MKNITTKHILSVPTALILSVTAASAVFLGSSKRPELVTSPFLAAVVCSICFFLLLVPFLIYFKQKSDILSPEIMGGVGYFFWIGIAAITNYSWPGLAVNPSLFSYLPLGIFAQTVGALSFFTGARIARKGSREQIQHKNNSHRLAIVLSLYAIFAFYLSFITPRTSSIESRLSVLSGEKVSWITTVGPFIVLQTLPMIIAANFYIKKTNYRIVKYSVMLVFFYCFVIFILSGSRSYSAEVIFSILIANVIANKNFSFKPIMIAMSFTALIVIGGTILRLAGGTVIMSPSEISFEALAQRIELVKSGLNAAESVGVKANFHENLVYHLADNQTMAMLIKNDDQGLLYGHALFNALLGALPDKLRPTGYAYSNDMIVENYSLVKEMTIDAFYETDWQMNIGVLGFADFGWLGLVGYSFALGYVLRSIYDNTVLNNGLGEAGWLVYTPLISLMWSPFKLGPDSPQVLRLILILALALWWTTDKKALPLKQTTDIN